MARPRKNDISIEELIVAQENAVSKAKTKYDQEVTKLKDLLAKKDEMRRKQLIAAVENSNRSYEEIMAFIQGE